MSRKKKLILQIVMILLISFIGFTVVVELQYNITPLEYIKYSRALTDEEQAYLDSKESIIYSMDWKAPPLTFTDEETGRDEGLLVDYMLALSIELGIDVEFDAVPFNEVMDSLDSGRADMSDLFESPKRAKKYAVTQPLYRLRGITVVRSESEISSMDELEDKNVALIEDDFAVEYFDSNYPDIPYMTVTDMKEAIEMLLTGRVDAVAGDETVIEYYVSEMNRKDSIREVGDGLYEQNVTFSVLKENEMLLNILNKGILNLKKKNILVQAQEKWFNTSTPDITDINAMRWLPALVAALLLFVLGLFIWQSQMSRKIAERTGEIQRQKDNQRTIIDNIHAMLFVLDKNDIITDMNHMAVEVLKDEPEEITGKSWNTIPLLAGLSEAYEKASGEGTTLEFQGRYYTMFRRKLNAVDGSSLVIIDDNTEKTMTEMRLHQESKMSAIGQLAAGLAHEIRNPLGLIKNYTYILSCDMEEDEVASHALQAIGESTDRINGLIENLLSFSRLSDETIKSVDIYGLLENIASLEEKKMEKAGIRFEISCEENARFCTSEETLKITLINLVNNAVDAISDMKDGGISRDEECIISCIVKGEGDLLVIEVADNGPGIPERDQEYLFVPFYTTKDYGTGLGLYTVSTELEKIGGTIRVESRPGQGARFIVTIPANSEGGRANEQNESGE